LEASKFMKLFNFFQKKPLGQELTLKIQGMHCTSCAMNIDGALEDTDGVLSAHTSYAKAEVKVSFDPKKLNEAQIRKIIADQGYTT
jgi:copper chaperone CopZ